MEITRPSDAVRLKALIHGPAGSGKTYLVGTLADDSRTSPTLVLDFEGGLSTLVGRDVDVAVIRDWRDYNEAYKILADPKSPYQSVGVDSITETQVGGLLQILEGDSKRPDPDTLAQADWGVILVKMRRFVRHFRDLPIHVVMTALSGDDLDKQVGRIKVPLVQGSFKDEIAGIFDVVGYLAQSENEEGETERLLLLRNYPAFRVKARTPMGLAIPNEIVDPDITKLLDALGYEQKKGKSK